MSSLNLLIVAALAASTVVLTPVGSRTAAARRLARLWQAQETWAEAMDRR
ncbi:MAG: hypothetical protein JOZ53_09195 [Planctomycetaceae bacterium]|nr:hypothetical protein [Planctomycetaceae bacterium]